jgi:vacuolar-type H+-ATPase subunit I/STV1
MQTRMRLPTRARRSVKINFMVTKKEAAVIDETAGGLDLTKTALLVYGASVVQRYEPLARKAGVESLGAFIKNLMTRVSSVSETEAERDRLRAELAAARDEQRETLRASQRVQENAEVAWQQAFAAEASKSDLYNRVAAREEFMHHPKDGE